MENLATVLREADGHVIWITLNRPEAFNALNQQMLDDLERVLLDVEKGDFRCAVITGAGSKAFVAGADISQMSGFSAEEAVCFSRRGHKVLKRLEQLPIPVIAAVNGYALGGGCELALSCDIRICVQNAVFGQPEVGLGIIPGFGGTQRLAREIGKGMALEMILSGGSIKAEEAMRIGLVNALCQPEELHSTVKRLADRIAMQAPIAVRAAKRIIHAGLDVTLEEGLELEAREFASCFDTQDQKTGMHAFLHKQKNVLFCGK